jgi:murein DD-endopeptidase MepM/ murein hydrolase activator NlpD
MWNTNHFYRFLFLLLLLALAELAATQTPSYAGDKSPEAKLLAGEPILRMPFPAGVAVLCIQGNCSREGYSHHWPDCLHALDLFAEDENQTILAAAAGTVASVFNNAKKGDSLAGGGCGNYVTIDHGNGFFTLYAHLRSVLVNTGDIVSTGTKIGVIGNTGNAGALIHLHFSLHRVSTYPKIVVPTVPMHIITADLCRPANFQVHSSLEFIGPDHVSGISPLAHIYASENSKEESAILGKPGSHLKHAIEASSAALRQAANILEGTSSTNQ